MTILSASNPGSRRPGRLGVTLIAAAAAATVIATGASADASSAPRPGTSGFHVFSKSFHENTDGTVTLPLYSALSGGKKVSFVITDASTRSAAQRLGVNWAPRLANVVGTAAVQKVRIDRAGLHIPAGVDFDHTRVVVPGPTGFPPAQAVPGAVGEAGYSPLIQLPDGTVLDAPQIANGTGRAAKVVSLDSAHHTVSYRETNGFYDGHRVHYVSFEASIPLTAALENAALAPALDASPPDDPRSTGNEGHPAREEIGIVTNGQLGARNPQRQGLSSALLDKLDPLNILGEVPEDDPASHYSPLWDANLATWTPKAVAAHQNVQQRTFDDLLRLADQGKITAPGGGPFGRSNFVINCPPISIAD